MTTPHPHMSPEEFAERLDDYTIKVTDLIAKHGWMLQGVFGGAEQPEFVYTVGLTELNHPEIFTYLPYDVGGGILNTIGERIRAGAKIATGVRDPEVLGHGLDVVFIPMTDTGSLGLAHRLYGHAEALQMCWPDSENRLPWEAGFSERSRYPLHGEAPA